MGEKVLMEYGTAPHRFRVVDARDWNCGYTVDAEYQLSGRFVTILMGLSFEDAKARARKFSEISNARMEDAK